MAEYRINNYRAVYKRAVELYNEGKFRDAVPLLEMVCEHDKENFDACFYLADCLYNGKGISKNIKRAFQFYMIAASNKNIEASYMIGLCYFEGTGIAQESTQAVAWFTEAAKYGHPLSQYYLGMAYLKGEGISKDIPRAAQWLVHAAKQGIVEAQREAAICYEMLGKMSGAAKLYLTGAENGDAYCQEKIADCYADGNGCLQCSELALHYYEMAANQGNVNAQVKMANRYAEGKGVKQSIKNALFWWNKAAQGENAEAQNKLAECYQRGEGIGKNEEIAVSWWLRSAQGGNVDAMIHLAETLTDPTDPMIEPDLITAKYWWTKAAESGDPYAMYRLGDCFERGYGIPAPSLEDAFQWYRLASQNGSEEAAECAKRFTKSMGGKIKLKKI